MIWYQSLNVFWKLLHLTSINLRNSGSTYSDLQCSAQSFLSFPQLLLHFIVYPTWLVQTNLQRVYIMSSCRTFFYSFHNLVFSQEGSTCVHGGKGLFIANPPTMLKVGSLCQFWWFLSKNHEWLVEGHLNPRLFNPKLQPQTFQLQTFQPQTIRPWFF